MYYAKMYQLTSAKYALKHLKVSIAKFSAFVVWKKGLQEGGAIKLKLEEWRLYVRGKSL